MGKKQVEEQLKEKQKFMNSLLENSPYPISVFNPDVTIRYVNPALEKLTGFSAAEVIGKKAPYPWWTEETLEKTTNDFMQSASMEIHKFEELFKKKNGERFRVEIISTPITIDNEIKYHLASWVDITARKNFENHLLLMSKQSRELSLYLENDRERERKRIAREIHDEFGQLLAVLKMDLFWLGKKWGTDKQLVNDKLEEMIKRLDIALAAVKKICTELRPRLLDEVGLVAAIEYELEGFQKRTGIICEFNHNIKNISLDQDLSIAIYRIFQEAIINIFKHANASKATVSLTTAGGLLMLKVVDNGCGFLQNQYNNPQTFGLLGIKERTSYLGGSIRIASILNKGTSIIVKIPIDELEGRND